MKKNRFKKFQKIYADSSLEIQKKMEFLLINNIIMVFFSIFVILDNLIGGIHFIGFITGCFSFVSSFFIFFFLYKKHKTYAINGYIAIILVLIFFYIIGDYVSAEIYTLSRISELLTFIVFVLSSVVTFAGSF